MARKVCGTCKQEKDEDEFYWHRQKGKKDVRNSKCKECCRAYNRAYHAGNREKIRARRKKDPERHLEAMRRYTKRRRTTLRGFLISVLAAKRSQCRRRKIPCTITVDDLLALHHSQKGRCCITHRELEWGSGIRTPFRLSLDRIDSAFGYVPGNVRLLTVHANLARAEFGDRYLQLLAQDVFTVMGPLFEPLATSTCNVPRLWDWMDRVVRFEDGIERWFFPFSGAGEMNLMEYGTRRRDWIKGSINPLVIVRGYDLAPRIGRYLLPEHETPGNPGYASAK